MFSSIQFINSRIAAHKDYPRDAGIHGHEAFADTLVLNGCPARRVDGYQPKRMTRGTVATILSYPDRDEGVCFLAGPSRKTRVNRRPSLPGAGVCSQQHCWPLAGNSNRYGFTYRERLNRLP